MSGRALRLGRHLLPLLAVAGLGGGAAAQAPSAPLSVGAQKVDITPDALAGLNPMGGGAFASVHDPIFARTLLLRSGNTSVAIVSIDAIEVGDMTPLRRRIERELGVPFDHIMITATHDHNAPRLGDVSPGALAHPGGAESRAYTEAVFGKVVSALRAARAAARPARFGLGTGEANVNVNRDAFTLRDGWHMGFNADGPSNKTVWVLKFVDEAGRPIAALFNYAVHNAITLGTNMISGDLSGVAQHYVEEQMGAGVVALWTMGPAGDQNPRIFPQAGGGGGAPVGPGTPGGAGGPPPGGPGGSADPQLAALKFRAAEAQGVVVGGEVVRVAGTIERMSGTVRLAADTRDVQCPTKQGKDQMADMTVVHVPAVTLRLSLVMLDDVALAGVGGEVVTNIYTHLAQASPLRNTIMVTLTNDRIGYIPDDAAYDRPIFEVNGSPMARGCAENAIVGGITDMIRANRR